MKKKPIIIDTDPGIDDAVAIAVALYDKSLDVRLITTVHGNVGLKKVTRNALKLLHFFNKEIPVAAGSDRPLLREVIDASEIHGESGLDGYERSEEHTSELQSRGHLVCRLLLEKKKSTVQIRLDMACQKYR